MLMSLELNLIIFFQWSILIIAINLKEELLFLVPHPLMNVTVAKYIVLNN